MCSAFKGTKRASDFGAGVTGGYKSPCVSEIQLGPPREQHVFLITDSPL